MAGLLWVWVTVPLALGTETLFFRDVFTTHLHLERFGAEQLAAGRVPAFNPGWGLGQPFRGNPNALPFYPGRLLYLVLPFWTAFNLHFALHWLLAGTTMWLLAQALGTSRTGALLAAITYGAGGWTMSLLSFYNLLTVTAWWPLVIWGVVRGDRRGVAVSGLACGLALLGGEPVLAALGLGPLVTAAIGRWGWRGGIERSCLSGGLGLLIAAPQLVATLRTIGFTVRGALAASTDFDVAKYGFPLVRYLELLTPLPFGRLVDLGAAGYGPVGVLPGPPYLVTLYFGLVGLWLAARGAARHRSWAWWAVGGLALATLGSVAPGPWSAAAGSYLRYPVKLCFWSALAVPILVGRGFDRPANGDAPTVRRLALAGAGLGLTAPLWLPTVAGAGSSLARPEVGWQIVGLPLATASVLLGAAAWALARDLGGWVPLFQLASLSPLLALAPTLPTAEIAAPPPWVERLPPHAAVAGGPVRGLLGGLSPPYELSTDRLQELTLLLAADLDYATGPLHGLQYPVAPDLEGLSTPFSLLVLSNLPQRGWPERRTWLRVLGVDAIVTTDHPPSDLGFRVLDETIRAGVPTRLSLVPDPLPFLSWPTRVQEAGSPIDAFRLVETIADPGPSAVVPDPVAQGRLDHLRLVASGPDRIEVEVDGSGGLLVVRRLYHPLWRARTAAGDELATLPVDVALLGVVLPPGRQRLLLDVDPRPVRSALVLALLASVAGAAAALAPVRRPVTAGRPA